MSNDVDTIGKMVSTSKIKIRQVYSDTRFTSRFIWSVIEDHIEWLLKRESDKLKLIQADYIFQTKKCVDIIEVPTTDSACGVSTRCTVYRTRDKLPRLYEDSNGVIIKSVYTLDGSQEFTHISVQEYMRKLENPLSRYDKTLYFFYNNGYLYFPKSRIKKIMVKGYFRDTVINDCEMDEASIKQSMCISKLDQPVRIPGYIKGELKRFVNEELINTIKVPEDHEVNKKDTPTN